METLYVHYEGHRPFIQAVVTDQNGQVRWKGVDSSITNLIKDVKNKFRGYQLKVQLPSKPIKY